MLILFDFIGVCFSWFLEKIVCWSEDLSFIKCVNELSIFFLCYSNIVDIYYKRSFDGNYIIFVSVLKEVIRKYSLVNVIVYFEGIFLDFMCYYNGFVLGMLFNIRYIWMIRCRIIFMIYIINNRMEGVFIGVFFYFRVKN